MPITGRVKIALDRYRQSVGHHRTNVMGQLERVKLILRISHMPKGWVRDLRAADLSVCSIETQR